MSNVPTLFWWNTFVDNRHVRSSLETMPIIKCRNLEKYIDDYVASTRSMGDRRMKNFSEQYGYHLPKHRETLRYDGRMNSFYSDSQQTQELPSVLGTLAALEHLLGTLDGTQWGRRDHLISHQPFKEHMRSFQAELCGRGRVTTSESFNGNVAKFTPRQS